jgi:hypothetical protein
LASELRFPGNHYADDKRKSSFCGIPKEKYAPTYLPLFLMLTYLVEQLLEAMEVPMDYKGPELEILIRDIKQDNTSEVIEKVLSHIKVKPAKVGVFLKD